VNQRGTLLVLFNQRETPNPKLTLVNELGPSQTLSDPLKKASSQLMLQTRVVLVEESDWLLCYAPSCWLVSAGRIISDLRWPDISDFYPDYLISDGYCNCSYSFGQTNSRINIRTIFIHTN